VVGDVNSTAACGLVAKKLCVGLAHIEAGLRSGDRTMPEEINRLVTDSISDLMFVTEKQALENLRREGHPDSGVHFVGHVMIDNLLHQIKLLENQHPPIGSGIVKALGARPYAALTMHRPANVDSKPALEILLRTLCECGRKAPIIFPCHPRTRKRIEDFGLGNLVTNLPASLSPASQLSGVLLTEPLGYMDFLTVWKGASVVITDSGGLQEETTALKVPCITIRENTERPITVETGSNEIAGRDAGKITNLFSKALSGQWKACNVPELWDGKASERIVKVLAA
jgi:UDP-N-acetylglucosamine 2-epimerase (non-hydrolysing)